MTGIAKRNALILLALVMVISVIIATSLPQLVFQPGMPLPSFGNGQAVIAPVEEQPLVIVHVNDFVKAILAFMLAGAMLYVLYRLLRRVNRQELTIFIWPAIIISWLVGGIIFLMMLMTKAQVSIPEEIPIPTPEPLPTAPLGPAPSLLIWLVGIALVACILIGVWMFVSSSRRATTMDVVGLEAEKAWQALRTGLDLKDVIIGCYRQMSLALQKDRGIEREDSMTTREFEHLLESAGLPHDPIHQLTQLFEAARYGNWQPNPKDEQKAINCLEAIMLYSREARGSEAK